MTDLDYAIQRMRDALDNLERGIDDYEESIDDLAGGLDDARVALGIELEVYDPYRPLS